MSTPAIERRHIPIVAYIVALVLGLAIGFYLATQFYAERIAVMELRIKLETMRRGTR